MPYWGKGKARRKMERTRSYSSHKFRNMNLEYLILQDWRKMEDAQFKRFLDLFKEMHINLPLVEALSQMPKYVNPWKTCSWRSPSWRMHPLWHLVKIVLPSYRAKYWGRSRIEEGWLFGYDWRFNEREGSSRLKGKHQCHALQVIPEIRVRWAKADTNDIAVGKLIHETSLRSNWRCTYEIRQITFSHKLCFF